MLSCCSILEVVLSPGPDQVAKIHLCGLRS